MLALVLLAAVPLLRPAIPPLIDLPGHMAGYRIQMDLATSPWLSRYYLFDDWVIGNLGVNLLVMPLSKLVGLEPAVKLVVTSIPPLMVLGLLWSAHEAHGRIPPTALFAVPLAYSFPFNFGFVNFALSMALAYVAFGLWLMLGKLGRLRLRTALFVPISLLLWLCHTFGWATFCVLAFSGELVRELEQRRPVAAGWHAGLRCWPLAAPIVAMVIWRTKPVEGATTGWNPVDKFNYLLTPFRSRWRWLDMGALALTLGVVALAIRGRRLAFLRPLALAALIFLGLYLALPRLIFGSAYADLRLVPFILATALIAIAPLPSATPRWRAGLALAGLAFILVRFGAETVSLAIYDRSFTHELAALDHVPRGARMVTFTGTSCRNIWTMTRLDHIAGMAVVRREAFSNDQWSTRGALLARANYPQAGAFAKDPSQIVRLTNCSVNRWPTLDESLRKFPRAAFDYVWLINAPPHDPALLRGLEPVWQSGNSALYRIADHSQPR